MVWGWMQMDSVLLDEAIDYHGHQQGTCGSHDHFARIFLKLSGAGMRLQLLS
jgi:hypothetical protein